MSGNDLRAGALEARRWLFDQVFPLWSAAGFDDRSGQFVEQITLAGQPQAEVARRTLVQARQLYVFSVAARMGWDGPWRRVMTAAADRLLAHGRTDEGDWIYSFDAEGRPLDRRRDLYTQAFVIFGLAHAATALERFDLMAAARETRRRLDRDWRAPSGGFVEGELYPGVRRQNPHMHLLEAAMALWDAGGEAADADLAGELVSLFKARFAADCGVLEYFDDRLVPLPDERGRVTEPGHAFEWSWLIGRWEAIGGADESALAERLYASGRRGLSPDGIVRDELWSDGTVKTASARLWPQTEHLKAALDRVRRSGGPADVADAERAHTVLLAYLRDAHPGAWRDRILADGGWAPGPSPASSGYHVVCALNELIQRLAQGALAPDAT